MPYQRDIDNEEILCELKEDEGSMMDFETFILLNTISSTKRYSLYLWFALKIQIDATF